MRLCGVTSSYMAAAQCGIVARQLDDHSFPLATERSIITGSSVATLALTWYTEPFREGKMEC